MSCIKYDTCHKVNIILDKDMLDFQYADAIRQVCGDCTTKNKAVITVELELDDEVIAERIAKGQTIENIKKELENHVSNAVGNQKHDGWQVIADVDSIKVEVK